MKVLAGVVATLVAVQGCAGAETTFAWVPTEDCSSPLKVCYEGSKERLESVSSVDVLNLCRTHSKIIKGTCSENGYERLVGEDPLFSGLKVYLPKTHKASDKRVDILTHALNVLQTAEEGLCWKHIQVRKGHFAKNCTSDEEQQLDICWEKCHSNSEGMGPLCLQSCDASHPISFGPLCCDSQEDCKKFTSSEAMKLVYDLGKAVMDRENPAKLIEDLRKLIADAKGLDLQVCPQ